MNPESTTDKRPRSSPGAPAWDLYWAELGPCEHHLQIYEDDDGLLHALEAFVAAGLRDREGVVVIATEPHRAALRTRLERLGLDLSVLAAHNVYMAIDADETLARFMVNGTEGLVPDEKKFQATVSELFRQAAGVAEGQPLSAGRPVRAFGEMVALLLARGQTRATVRLEHFWQQLCRREAVSVFCAYPSDGFNKSDASSIKEICGSHTRLLHYS
ncbi:MAG TPA: MEDS domain-containing protein [Phycisphaerales bacterium]|nr:MEDS domain-containing protein [Phycisphaerales bacterium]